jgi:hypothetical protein
MLTLHESAFLASADEIGIVCWRDGFAPYPRIVVLGIRIIVVSGITDFRKTISASGALGRAREGGST